MDDEGEAAGEVEANDSVVDDKILDSVDSEVLDELPQELD